MKKSSLMVIAASFVLLGGASSALASDEGETFAKNWLRMSCFEAIDSQNEQENFLKYKDELKAYLLSAVQRGLELDGLREEEAALGQVYDQNIKMLNENRPGWMTVEFEKKVRSVSREAFISEGKETLAQSYKARALKGLELLRSLPSR
jgi:hypothetical protein